LRHVIADLHGLQDSRERDVITKVDDRHVGVAEINRLPFDGNL
jgi:hypothetical protein